MRPGELVWYGPDGHSEPSPGELVAAVKQLDGVDVLWMMPEDMEHLRGTLWSGPPMMLRGHAVLVVPLSASEEPSVVVPTEGSEDER